MQCPALKIRAPESLSASLACASVARASSELWSFLGKTLNRAQGRHLARGGETQVEIGADVCSWAKGRRSSDSGVRSASGDGAAWTVSGRAR